MGVRRLTRSPAAYWLAVAGLALFTGLTVARTIESGRAAVARFGSLRTAVVAARPVAMGAVLGPADVVERRIPLAFLPEGWTPAATGAVGRTVLVPLVPGQAVLRTHLAPAGLEGVAALLPPGSSAVAVPTGSASPPLRRGDHVDVLATFDRGQGGTQPPTFPVARDATAVDVAEDRATLAVTPDEAARVAYALAHGVVNLAVRPGPQGSGQETGRPGNHFPAQNAEEEELQAPAASATNTATPRTTR